jgi:hypothetical protein
MSRRPTARFHPNRAARLTTAIAVERAKSTERSALFRELLKSHKKLLIEREIFLLTAD